MLKPREILCEGTQQGWCLLSVVPASLKSTSTSVLNMTKFFPSFLSTTCQHLPSTRYCGVFALHLLEVTCQSSTRGEIHDKEVRVSYFPFYLKKQNKIQK